MRLPKIIYAIRVKESPIVWLSPYPRFISSTFGEDCVPCDTVSCPTLWVAEFNVALGRLINYDETVKFRVVEVKKKNATS